MESFKKGFGWFVFALIILLILATLFYFSELNSPTDSAFVIYNSNPGIILISSISFVAQLAFIATFLLNRKLKDNQVLKIILISSALVIAFLEWVELWYGSTFYYGEVRDKQGLFFPFTSAFLITFVLLNINFCADEKRNNLIKLNLIILINLGLYLLYKAVNEPWRLWQS